jgi:hypothetical protein
MATDERRVESLDIVFPHMQARSGLTIYREEFPTFGGCLQQALYVADAS